MSNKMSATNNTNDNTAFIGRQVVIHYVWDVAVPDGTFGIVEEIDDDECYWRVRRADNGEVLYLNDKVDDFDLVA